MKSTRSNVFRTRFLTTVGLLTLALGSEVDAQNLIPFDTPAVATYASPDHDFDVNFNFSTPPLTAKRALSSSQQGGGVGIAQALANLNNRRGFMALAEAISPGPNALSSGGLARVAMDFIAYDPLGQDRVKLEVDFDAIATAGAPLRDGGSTTSLFYVEVGPVCCASYVRNDPDGMKIDTWVRVPSPPLLVVEGWHSKIALDNGIDRNGVWILGDGQEIERTEGSGPLRFHKKIVINVRNGIGHVITIDASAQVNGFTFVDPVITPHPDNPEVVVTLRGAVDPNPPPLAILSPEELTNAGIDITPLQELGLIDSPSSLTFLSPLPDADYKVRANIKVKFQLVDSAGTPIPDATAKSLVKACQVMVGLDTATRCARYNAKQDFFLASVKVPKGISVGTHEVVAQVLASDGAVADSATMEVSIH